MVKAEYISHTVDIMGDIDKIEIRDIKTRKHKWVTPEQIVSAVQKGLIEIKYIKVSFDGKIHITQQKKKMIFDKIKELEKEIKKLENSSSPIDRDELILKRLLLNKLYAEKYKFKKYIASDYK